MGTFSILYLICYALAFLVPKMPFSWVFSALAGSLIIMVGFTAMHDASHYALGTRDSWKNKLVLRVWNSIALWDSAKWLYHHMVRHHSFTGDAKLDPDVQHAAPNIRKHLETNPKDYVKPLNDSDWFAQLQTAIYALALNYGQLYFYIFKWNFSGMLWNLPLAQTRNMFQKFAWEYMISAFIVLSQVYKANAINILVYWTAVSISYGMCILADHDTYESAVENHLSSGGKQDWGEIQVRHSSDFAAKGLWGQVFGEVFGSINVQIGHHLFPSVNHVHLRELIPIIRTTCEEFNIPYASHDTLLGALLSVSKTLKAMNHDSLAKSHSS